MTDMCRTSCMMTDMCRTRCMFQAQCVNHLQYAVSMQCLLLGRQNSEGNARKEDTDF